MSVIKKYIQLAIAFLLGVLITYLAMSLHIAKQELKAKSSQSITDSTAIKTDPQPAEESPNGKHWLDERIEKQTTETQERIKQQQSQGDVLKSKFEEFVE
jgi:hypothetical protein